MAEKAKKYWGFDTRDIDESVRPQDNFYAHANGGWLRKIKIPPEEARWGAFNTLRYETERRLKKIVENAHDPLVGRLYRSAVDKARRAKLGVKPLEPLRNMIRSAKNKDDLLDVIARFHRCGIPGFWGAFVDQDSRQSSRYRLHLWQGGLGMPEREYYLLDKPEQNRVRAAYILHIKKMIQLAGASQVEAETVAKTVLGVETRLARASMRKEDVRDAEKVYHKMPLGKLEQISPKIDWRRYLAHTGAMRVRRLIVGQPEFFAAVSKIIEESPLENLKTYLEWHLVNGSAALLSDPFVRQSFDFYSRTLAGKKKLRPLWRRAVVATESAAGFAVGRLYIRRYFPQSAKRAIDALVSDLFAVYEERLAKLDWMSAATKRRAIRKLRAMKRKIGYPTKWRSYKGLVVTENDFFGNMLRASAFEHARQMKKLRGPVDRAEWHMPPQTVNAYCNFGLNEIVFPAAILQWPFFDPAADAAVNYAGIGSVIGHEITHGFDDQGSKFDHKGNLRQWWSKSDRKRFEKKAKKFITQANAQFVAQGIRINGEMTLGENIADHGGLVIAYDAYQRYLQQHGRKIIAGLSPEERFFFGFAQMEREAVRPEYLKTQVLTDPHAPGPWRVNGPLSNFEPFYKTFIVKKPHQLHRPPRSRAQMW